MSTFPPAMMFDSVWLDRQKFIEAENHHQLYLAANNGEPAQITTKENSAVSCTEEVVAEYPVVTPVQGNASSPLIDEISTMRANIKSQLQSMGSGVPFSDSRLSKLQEENESLRCLIVQVSKNLADLQKRVEQLEAGHSVVSNEANKKEANEGDDDDDDFDLFGDDDDEDEEETEEEKTKREALLAKYHEKKAKKPVLIAKSNIILDVKPWDDETDMEALEQKVRTIEMDGLLWGNSKLVPLAYGIKKLQISCVVEDDKVGSDILSEKITEFEDFVQSVDVAAFNKI